MCARTLSVCSSASFSSPSSLLAEGLVALMIKPAVDYVLDPTVVGSALPLGTIPFTNHTVYLNTFLPSSFHNVKTIFFFTLLMIFGIKAIAEYLGSTEIQ